MQHRGLKYAWLGLCLFVVGWCMTIYGVPRGGQSHAGRTRPHRPSEILIKPVDGVSIQTIAASYRLTIIDQAERLNVWRLRIPSGMSEDALLDALEIDSAVDFGQLNYLVTHPEAQQESSAFVDQSNPPYVDGSSPSPYFNQAAYEQIGARAAWTYTTGRNVKAAVVDTGVSRTHPALVEHVRADLGWNFLDNNANTEEPLGGRASGHGTFVSGLIARIAPGAQIIPLRALDRDGIGDSYTVARAIVQATRAGAQVINLSIGLTAPAAVIDDALDLADQAGAVVVAAAGNNNCSEDQYIASYPTVLGVGAVNGQDIRAPFSNYGPYVRVVSPGVELYSTFVNGQFASWSGTSFSTALVSGQAALLKALRPALAPADLIAIIQAAADDIDALNPQYAGYLGSGRIQCLTAVGMLP